MAMLNNQTVKYVFDEFPPSQLLAIHFFRKRTVRRFSRWTVAELPAFLKVADSQPKKPAENYDTGA